MVGDRPGEDVIRGSIVANVEGEDLPSRQTAQTIASGVKHVTVEDERVAGFAQKSLLIRMPLTIENR